MQLSTTRILTTHTGSLPRPEALVRLYVAKARGEPVDAQLAEAGQAALEASVRQQRDAGIDVGNNGEQQREAFFLYVRHRMSGFGDSWQLRNNTDMNGNPWGFSIDPNPSRNPAALPTLAPSPRRINSDTSSGSSMSSATRWSSITLHAAFAAAASARCLARLSWPKCEGKRSGGRRRIAFVPICKSDPALSSSNGRFRVAYPARYYRAVACEQAEREPTPHCAVCQSLR